MNQWVIGDTHFYHTNIIEFCNRPFSDVNEMNEAIIRKWNNVVDPDDIVYHLGDVGLTRGTIDLSKIVNRLFGRKILIRGNHDGGVQSMIAMGFIAAVESIVLQVSNHKLLLQHGPLYTALPEGVSYVIHGHIHNTTHRQRVESSNPLPIPDYNINVSCEVINYQPVTVEHVVKEKIRSLKGAANV